MQQRFLLHILLLAKRVSGTTTPIIRSSRILSSGCCLWYLVRCNRGFYCTSYCLLNMFRAPLRPSSGAQEYYTMVSACGIWLDATEVFSIADLIACSTCFGHHYAHHQELKSIIQCLLPVVFHAVVSKLLVWCGAEGYVSGLQDAAASCKPKYHRQQPPYNTLEFLMMGIVVPETC